MNRTQQWIAVAVIVGAVAGGVVLATRTANHDVEQIDVGTKAPNFRAVTLDSTPVTRTLADYKGQVTLINIWATWCLPCEKEMPMLEKLYEEFGPKGLRLVAISADAPGMEDPIRDFIKQYKLTFDVLYDSPGGIKRDYMALGFPETFIVGKDGVIRFKQIAAISDAKAVEIRGVLTNLLAERGHE